MYDEKMVKFLQGAFKNAIISLCTEHKEHFYYFAFVFDSGMHPYISAWSYEAYEKSVIENQVDEEDKKWWKWDYADSPYAVYGYEDYFCEVNKLLDERANKLSLDELYDVEWDIRISSMEEALRHLDEEGFFGVKDKRKGIVVNVEVAPPDYHEYERAMRLNPQSKLLFEYLENCDKEEENE